MANLTKTLLESIKDVIDTDATLSYINASYIIQSFQEVFLPEYLTNPPFALIYPLTNNFTPNCMPDIGQEAAYNIGISVLQESWQADENIVGDGNGHKGVSEIEADIQSIFDRNTFSISGLYSAIYTASSYSPTGFTKLSGLAQVHGSLQYTHEDILSRSIADFEYIMNPSSDTTCVAGTTITITHGIQRLYGSGGNVIMTAVPTLSQGVDGQIVILQGVNDSALVTLQDSTNLASSGLILTHARNMTLGKNDILMIMYDAGESAWIELSRRDNY